MISTTALGAVHERTHESIALVHALRVEIEHEARRQRRWRAVRGHREAQRGMPHSPPGPRRAALLRAELLALEEEVTP